MAKNKRERRFYDLHFELDTITTNEFQVELVEHALQMFHQAMCETYTRGQTKLIGTFTYGTPTNE